MPISVTCPKCKAEFNVSEKFAGKQGPCPKCKARITVPNLPAGAAPPADVKIHAPDTVTAAGKAVARGQVTQPIIRQETRLRPVPVVLTVIGIVLVLAAAKYAGEMFRGTAETMTQALALRCVALFIVGLPTAVGGYAFLRDDELESYEGGSLWLRAAISSLIYLVVWIGYYFIPLDFMSEYINWIFLAPPIFIIGAVTAMFCFDLDLGNGFFHYSLYVLVTLGLGWLAGLAMPWAPALGAPPAL